MTLLKESLFLDWEHVRAPITHGAFSGSGPRRGIVKIFIPPAGESKCPAPGPSSCPRSPSLFRSSLQGLLLSSALIPNGPRGTVSEGPHGSTEGKSSGPFPTREPWWEGVCPTTSEANPSRGPIKKSQMREWSPCILTKASQLLR